VQQQASTPKLIVCLFVQTAGPQCTLYVPGPILKHGENEVVSWSKQLALLEGPSYMSVTVFASTSLRLVLNAGGNAECWLSRVTPSLLCRFFWSWTLLLLTVKWHWLTGLTIRVREAKQSSKWIQ
jgi:hypothetical protein